MFSGFISTSLSGLSEDEFVDLCFDHKAVRLQGRPLTIPWLDV